MRVIDIHVDTPYQVLVARGILAQAGEQLARVVRPCRAAVITDDTVQALYADTLVKSLESAGFSPCVFAFPHGEENKNLNTYAQILNFLCENHLTRSDIIVSLGGGVVGDTAGFAAATYLRGVRCAHIPTTLLAMVDSSVGGKTAVDLPAGKNLCGAFWQPSLVLCDPDVLQTLPAQTLCDGLAECIKHGVLRDEALFDMIASGAHAERMEEMIARNIEIKADFVMRDEHDNGVRQMLNLGHTLGHAVEACSDFSVTHGQGVAVGMVYAARIAEKMGVCEKGLAQRMQSCLVANSLPVRAPYSASQLARVALGDKKRRGGFITLVLPERVGACMLKKVPVEELESIFAMGVEE